MGSCKGDYLEGCLRRFAFRWASSLQGGSCYAHDTVTRIDTNDCIVESKNP